MYALALSLVLFGATPSAGVPEPPRLGAIDRHDAVVLRLTESDLNVLLRDLAAAHGWQRFEGGGSRSSRGIHDLSYDLSLSAPRLQLSEGGLSLGFDILEANVDVGRLERHVASLPFRCENFGVRLDTAHPLGVELAFGLALEQGTLHLQPGEVTVEGGGKRAFRMIKPTRCRISILPRTIAWGMGKSRLRRRLSRLDEILLARVERFAAELDDDRGSLGSLWDLPGGTLDLRLSRTVVDADALTLSLDVSGRPLDDERLAAGEPPHIPPAGSHVALSAELVNAVLAANLPAAPGSLRAAQGNLRELLLSESIYTLIPGMREVPDRERLRFRVRVDAPPTVSWKRNRDPSDPGRGARLGISVGRLALEFFDAERTAPVGELRIVSGYVEVVPYVNEIAGVSLQVLANDWRVESRGIEHDDALIGAMLQELVFGELFETRYEPLLREGFRLGETGFRPTAFRVIDDYLVVDLVATASSSQAKR